VSTAALVRSGVGTAVSVGATPPFIGFYPTIMLIALLVGFGPGLLATLAAAAIAEYFFMEPLKLFALKHPLRDSVWLALFRGGGSHD
jgi:K+-sensing histidine kinase KdpD